ncbi:MAG: arylesterase [Rubrivivax sp.]
MARRDWGLHCSAVLLGLAAALATPARAQGPSASVAPPAAATGATSGEPVILILGDSLSAEYGLPRGRGWVALLEQRLQRERVRGRIVNASISGETSSGGRSRLPALLEQHRPQVLVVELGGNDALRGLPLAMTRDNLTEMVRRGQAAGARVLLLGMQMPPNFGRSYAEAFSALYAEVAKARQAALVPFFLRGVADTADPTALFQADRIHPNEEAQPKMLDNVWPALRPLLR